MLMDVLIRYVIPLIVLSLSIVTVVISSIATKRFLKGELKEVLQWLMPVSLAFFFTCFFLGIVFILITMVAMSIEMAKIIQYLIIFEGIFLILTSAFFIKIALSLYKFSEIYGFAAMPQTVVKDVYEQLADAVVKAAAAVAGPNALKYASDTGEIKVSAGGQVTIVKPEKLAVVKRLIEKYKAAIGPTIMESFKKGVKPILNKFSKVREEFPELA